MSNKQLQKQLDYLITHRGVQQQERLAREEYFKVRMRNSPSLRLKGLYVDSLYHLYMLHNPDSALYYEEMCLDIAQELHDTTWIISCMLGQYKTYSNITRFYEADDVHHAINKLPDEGDIVPLEGNTNAYRLRVGDYRIIYEVDNGAFIVIVVDAGNRGQIYKRR